MVMLACPPAVCQPAPAAPRAALLKPGRSNPTRAFAHEPAGAGATLPDGTPFDLWVTISQKGKATKYAVALCGWTSADGLLAQWIKADGTRYNLSFNGFAASCDCAACSYGVAAKADRRHGDTFGTYGCAKLDTFAALVMAGSVPDPRANGEADSGEVWAGGDDAPFALT